MLSSISSRISKWWSKGLSFIVLGLMLATMGWALVQMYQPSEVITQNFGGLSIFISTPKNFQVGNPQSIYVSVTNLNNVDIDNIGVVIVPASSLPIVSVNGATVATTFSDLYPGEMSTKQISLLIPDEGLRTLYFDVRVHVTPKGMASTDYSFQFSSNIESPLQATLVNLVFWVSSAIIILYIIQLLKQFLFVNYKFTEELERKVKVAEQKASNEPERVKPVWDVARYRLESYIEKNLRQVELIFVLSVFVTFMGFLLIVVGVILVWNAPTAILSAVVVSGAGVLTEFIGGTFLLIYRATLEQARHYLETLERINTVGMAMQILDTMPNKIQRGDWKNKTKAEITKLVISKISSSDEEFDSK